MLSEINKTEILELQSDINKFIAGEISATDLKHTSAPFGIYQQKNGKFMVRIRITGGLLSLKQMQAISEILNDEFGIGFAHLTTRQNIQLHDVPVESIYGIVEKAVELGLIFRGGGGNTYRNIMVSPEGAFSDKSVFNVQPYAAEIQNFVYSYDKAYALPRKLKISISCNDDDSALATIQDLGFIATIQNGVKGFKVFVAGGMGRKSTVGVKLIDFLPATDILKVVAGIIELFYDHGNRKNRNLARLRFLREKIGNEAFAELFADYVSKVTDYPKVDISADEQHIVDFGSAEIIHSDAFKLWQIRAASNTQLKETVSVELFVPNGNFSPEQFAELTAQFTKYNNPALQLTATQNLIIPFVKAESLPGLYNVLNDYSINLKGESFNGLIQSCIGSTFCKIGILNTPYYAEKASVALDNYFAEKAEKQAVEFKEIINSIKLSGCPNSCGAHLSAKLGFQGMKKKIDDVLTDVFFISEGAKINADETKLAEQQADFIKADLIADSITSWLNKR